MTAAHYASVTTVTRRLFGLTRVVYAIRCSMCAFRAEVDDAGKAETLRHRHDAGAA